MYKCMPRFTEHVDCPYKAAGILALCMETGRVLIALHGDLKRYTSVGGHLVWGEKFVEGALREFVEETLYDGTIALVRGYHYTSPVKNFEYVNFIGIVPHEFQPMWDHENLSMEWVSLSQLYGGRLNLLNEFETFTIESRPLIDCLVRTFGLLNE
jgi:8-oxo-dGTP pyrophosphatase MutT (NUDIX family)